MAPTDHTRRTGNERDDRRDGATATDGGRSVEGDRTRERNADEETMGDVSHTPPHGDGANRVWDGTRVYDGGETEDARVTEPDAGDPRVTPRDEADE